MIHLQGFISYYCCCHCTQSKELRICCFVSTLNWFGTFFDFNVECDFLDPLVSVPPPPLFFPRSKVEMASYGLLSLL